MLALEPQTEDLHDLLLRVASRQRREYFKLWNQIQKSEEWVAKSFTEKLARCLSELEAPQKVNLPPEVSFISMLSPDYPREFFELPQPPLGIFVRGNFNARKRAAVIGSRKPSPYSLRMTYRCVRIWAEDNWAIVSGGAHGIDSEAHRAALEYGAKTIAVLGGGLRRLYPRANLKLFESICEKGGALISEYPPLEEPKAYLFPERNRLIAAMSQVLFLAQAHDKSGSLSTARTALDLGREIFVLRPPPGDLAFAGSAALIEAGAKPLIDPQMLKSEYPEIALVHEQT